MLNEHSKTTEYQYNVQCFGNNDNSTVFLETVDHIDDALIIILCIELNFCQHSSDARFSHIIIVVPFALCIFILS